MAKKQTKEQTKKQDAKILDNARSIVEAFVELTGALGRRMDAVMDAEDGTPAKARAFLGIRTALTGTENLGHAHHCMALADLRLRHLFNPPELTVEPLSYGSEHVKIVRNTPDLSWLDEEPDMVAASLVRAAEHLAAVMASLATELDAADAANALVTKRQARRAA